MSQDAVHTLGSQRVYISEILKTDHFPRKVKLAKCVTKWLKYYNRNIIIRIQELRDAFIQVPTCLFTYLLTHSTEQSPS